MDNLKIAFQVVFPLFVHMSLGYVLRWKKVWDEHVLNVLNEIIFKLFLPVLVFVNILKTDVGNLINWGFLGYIGGSITVFFIALVLLIPYIEKENPRRSVLVQGIMRSNFIIFGLPITALLCGESKVGVVAVVTIVIIPIYNTLGVASFELFRGQSVRWSKIFKGIATNPLIIASISGSVFLGLGIKVPGMLDGILAEISKIATPLALMALGGSLRFGAIKRYTKQLIIGILGRLVVAPAIFVPIAIALGFRGPELVGIMSVFAAPHAVSSYTMAKQMGGDGELAGQLVVFSSVLSVFTIFCWVFILKHFALV